MEPQVRTNEINIGKKKKRKERKKDRQKNERRTHEEKQIEVREMVESETVKIGYSHVLRLHGIASDWRTFGTYPADISQIKAGHRG